MENNEAFVMNRLANYHKVEVARIEQKVAELFKAGKYTLAWRNVEKAQFKMDKSLRGYEVALSIHNKVKTIFGNFDSSNKLITCAQQ